VGGLGLADRSNLSEVMVWSLACALPTLGPGGAGPSM